MGGILKQINWKHLAVLALGVLLGIAGQSANYDFKADLCGQPQPAASPAP